MKKTIIIFGIMFFNCSVFSTTEEKMSIQEKDITIECIIENNKDIQIIIKNNTDAPIRLSNPCSANTFIFVGQGKVQLSQQIRIKVNPACAKKIFEIPSLQKATFYFDYTLSELYSMEAGKEYEISAVYYTNSSNLANDKGIKSKPFNYIPPHSF